MNENSINSGFSYSENQDDTRVKGGQNVTSNTSAFFNNNPNTSNNLNFTLDEQENRGLNVNNFLQDGSFDNSITTTGEGSMNTFGKKKM